MAHDKPYIHLKRLVFAALVAALSGGFYLVKADAQSIGEPGRGSGKNPLKNVYFGEQHLHTRNSPDAFAVGTRGSWDDAYQWALGKEVKLSTTGEKMKNQAMAMGALGYLEKPIVDDLLIKMIDEAFNMNARDPDQN